MEALYSHHSRQIARQQLFHLIDGLDSMPEESNILPITLPWTRRKQTAFDALRKLPRDRLVLGFKIYFLLWNGTESESDAELHPRPSKDTAAFLIDDLDPASVSTCCRPKVSLFGRGRD